MPKLFPAAGKAEKARFCEREWVCLHHCGKEGWSPREIGLHQFPLITQSLCYVALVAKSVEGSHMVKGKKNTLVLLVRKYSSSISLQYCWDVSHCQHQPQSTVTARASPLQVPPSASMVSRGPCLHVSGEIPPQEDVLTGTASHLQQGLRAPSQLDTLCLHQQPLGQWNRWVSGFPFK